MKLGILSALRRTKEANNLEKVAPESSDGPLEETTSSGLRQAELRVLFESTFAEMGRDLPAAAEDKKRQTKGHKPTNDFDTIS